MEDHGGSRDSREGGIDAGISVEDHGGSRDSGEGGIDAGISVEDHEEAGTVGSKE